MSKTAAARVLLVGNDLRDLAWARRSLGPGSSLPAQVEAAPTLRAIGELSTQADFDIALVDLDLPGVGAGEVVSRVRLALPEVPLIALARVNDEVAGLAAVGQGADDFICRGSAEWQSPGRAARAAIERRTFQLRELPSTLYDVRSHLPRRPIFLDRLMMAMRRDDTRGTRTAVGLIRLLDLQRITDTQGQLAAEIFERGLLKRLAQALSPTDTLATLGAGEYGCVIESLASPEQLNGLRRLMRQAFALPVTVPTPRGMVTMQATAVSIGLCSHPQNGRTPADLLAEAERRLRTLDPRISSVEGLAS
ncbi:MAG: response regulator [Myxococcales bacterium]|nr:response regulator [Myxococcales bacterium]